VKKYRGAIVGFGKAAAEAHLPGFRGAPGFEIVAVVDPSEERRSAALAALPGARVHADFAALAADETRIDFVDVATPPRFHAATAIEALARGFHVLCEKPLAIDPAEIADLRRSARRSQRALFTVHNWKYAPLFRRLHGLLGSGAVGEVREIEWQVVRPSPPEGAAEVGWRLDPEQAGGGILMDHGWHAFYLMIFLARRDPQAITATVTSAGGFGVEDSAECEIDFKDSVARIRLRWGGEERRTSGLVKGTLGSVEIDDDRLVVSAGDQPAGETRFSPPLSASSYHPEWFPSLLEDFRGEIQHPDRRGRNLAEAVRVGEMVAAAYRSGGQRISLTPATGDESPAEPG
jgi:predicted dehydrogenase